MRNRVAGVLALIVGLIGCTCLLAVPAQAATFTVNSTADAVDATLGDGVCGTAPGGGVCTLRAAIQESNALAGADIVILPPGTYTLTIPGPDEDQAAAGDLDILDDLTVAGAGTTSTIIDGGLLDRVFHLPFSSQANVDISSMTIRNGIALSGGGISNYRGAVTLTNCLLFGNTANGSGGGVDNSFGTVTVVSSNLGFNLAGVGGAIANFAGTVVITNSTISENTANHNGGAIKSSGGIVTLIASTISSNTAAVSGGAIYNFSSLITVTNSTFSGNTVTPFTFGEGGAIANSGGAVDLANNTITGNSAPSSGGGVFSSSGALSIKNTIVANNTGGNCGGAGITSAGHNLSSDASCGLTGSGDLQGIDPLLGPLADNGGPTLTHALSPTSPAIDTGSSDCPPPTTDQRDLSRSVDGNSDGLAACDIGAYEFVPGTFLIQAILPNSGGNAGSVSVTIRGSLFAAGATAKLAHAGQPDIVPDSVSVGADGFTVTATFNLRGAAPGIYDVVVSNVDGASATLPAAFTIEEGGAPQLWVDIVGRTVIRAGRAQTYWNSFGNSGNIDTEDIVVTTFIPQELNNQPLESAEDNGKGVVLEQGSTESSCENTGGEVEAWIITKAPSKGISSWKLFLKSSTSGGILKLFLKAYWGMVGAHLEHMHRLLQGQNPEVSREEINRLYQEFMAREINERIPLEDFATRFAGFVNSELQLTLDAREVYRDLKEMSALGEKVSKVYGLEAEVRESCTEKSIQPVAAIDPNDKSGPVGHGTQMFIASDHPFSYLVNFENQETATAPAQEVVITDQLDPATMDLATLSLGPISFGDWEITPPPGLSEYTTEVDLRPDNELLVRIHAYLDPDTALLTWRFTSIDPATGLPPEDPMAGFLPPNVTPPEGDGSVLFTVRPKANLPTGTEVRNQASIIFDVNAPILTPVWFNTLDNSTPQSQVLPLAASQPSATFPVQWTGTDEGAGIRDYNLFVSEDGGPFTPWLLNTPATGGSFTGQLGHQYAFYSVARDGAGNLEASLPISDTSTATPPGPDLTGVWNPVSQSCRGTGPTQQCKLQGSVLVRNQGSASAPVSLLRVLLSDDAVLGPEDSMLLETSVRSLAPGGSRAGRVRVRLPLGVSTTGKYLFAVLDPSNSVAETEEGNNTLRYGPLP